MARFPTRISQDGSTLVDCVNGSNGEKKLASVVVFLLCHEGRRTRTRTTMDCFLLCMCQKRLESTVAGVTWQGSQLV